MESLAFFIQPLTRVAGWRILSLSLLLLALGPMPRALAQGGLGFQVGGADAGPMVANPAAIFWNPAALGAMPGGTHTLLDIETVLGQGEYQRLADSNNSAYPEVNASVLFPLPFIGVVHDFGQEDWRFGFAVYIPFGSGGKWDADGPQRYHLIKGAEASLFFTGTATYKVTPKFFVGAGVSYVFSALQGEVSIDLINVVQSFLPTGFSVPTESPLFEARAQTGFMTAHNIAFNGGVFFQPLSNLDLGLSALLPIQIRYRGPIDFTLPDVVGLGEPALSFLGFDGSTITADGKISTMRPLTIMAGAAWRSTPQLTLEAMMVYALSSQRKTFKSELFNTGIPYLDSPEGTSVRETGAQDSYQLRGGAKYRLSTNWLVGGYLTFIESGVPSSHVGASNIGFNLLIPTWYSQYQYTPKSSIGFNLSPIFAFKRQVTNSIFDPTAQSGSGIGIPTGNGTYRGLGFQLGLAFTHKF